MCLRALICQLPIVERLVGVRAHPRLAAEDRVDPRDQLGDRERLGDVVVGAGVEAADLVALLRLRGEHDDRHGLVALAQRLAHAVAVVVGEHEVEQHAVGRPVHRGGQTLGTGAARLDLEAFELERVAEAAHDIRLVLDHEDALLRRLCRSSLPSQVLAIQIGSHSWNVAPCPGVLSTVMSPPCARAMCCTSASPMPEPRIGLSRISRAR